MVLTYTTDKEYKIGIISALLAENAIEFNIINKQDSMYKFGDIELYVDEINFKKAREIIDEVKI